MCVIFYYIAKHSPSLQQQPFKFILAANRDEFYFRSSKVAQFWENDRNILAGQDLQSGGTWLGINKKNGRLATLTNIMGGTDPEKQKLSRGSLITNFLRSQSTLNGETYCKNLFQDPVIHHNFNKFNLLTVDFVPLQQQENSNNRSVKTDSTDSVAIAYYFTNVNNSPPIWQNSNDNQLQYFGLGNSIWSKPFKKVKNGCTAFQKIIEKHNKHPNSEMSISRLTDSLLKFLRNDSKNFPDPQVQSQANEHQEPFTSLLSSTFVCIPAIMYGTRTHTLIFVDYNNQVYFSEWTMTEPIVPEQPTWHESNYKFQLFS